METTQPTFVVILVEPKYGGNIGAVARILMNFDVPNLYLVNPCPLDDAAYARAMHAKPILDNARVFSSLSDAITDLDYLVATSSIEHLSDKKHLRNAIYLQDFSKTIYTVHGTIGLLFGREDYGLFNTEIARSDIMVKIPTSKNYPSMNLSHAVAVVLYTLYIKQETPVLQRRDIGAAEKQRLYRVFSQILDQISYPKHKKENTEILFKRILGRAIPSTWEYHTLMGVFNKIIEKLDNKK